MTSMVVLAAGATVALAPSAYAAEPSFGMTIDSGKATISVSAGSDSLRTRNCIVTLDDRRVPGGFFSLEANKSKQFRVDVTRGEHEARITCYSIDPFTATAEANWQPNTQVPNPGGPYPPYPPEPTVDPAPPEPTKSPTPKPSPTKPTPKPTVSPKPTATATPTEAPAPTPSVEPTTDAVSTTGPGATASPVRGPAPTIDASDIPDPAFLGVMANGVSRPNLWGLGGIISFAAAAVIIVIGRMRKR